MKCFIYKGFYSFLFCLFIMKEITEEKLAKYFDVTARAIAKIKVHKGFELEAANILDMVKRYYDDANYYYEKGDFVTAFAALNYAHGWLDCGARIKIFDVDDDSLFVLP